MATKYAKCTHPAGAVTLASARLKTERKWGLFCGIMIWEINGRHFCGIPLWFISHLLMNKKKKRNQIESGTHLFLARRGSMRWQVFVYTSAPFLSLKLYCYLTVLVGVRDDKLSLIWKPFLCPYLFYGRVHWCIDHKGRIDIKNDDNNNKSSWKRLLFCSKLSSFPKPVRIPFQSLSFRTSLPR